MSRMCKRIWPAREPVAGLDERRWFGGPRHAHPDRHAPSNKETVSVSGCRFQALFRTCEAGGVIVSFPAIPHLMTRGATHQHARIKAIALVQGYVHDLRAAGRLRPPGDRRAHHAVEILPRAA